MTLRQDKSATFDQEQEKNTVRYLRDNPDFFERHLDLLADMLLPHESGKAISLIERQVAILREQKDEHKKKLQHLVTNARENEQLVTRLNNLILDMLDTQSLQQLLNLVEHRIAEDFSADAVKIRLLNTSIASDKSSWTTDALGALERATSKRRPVCGRLPGEQMQGLFNEEGLQINSVALIPLLTDENNRQGLGLLAIGSQDSTRFRADMDTLFLAYLGKILTRLISQYLNS